MAQKMIWRDSPQYEQARVGRLFNHRYPDRYPRGIIEASCVQDVVDAIKLAEERTYAFLYALEGTVGQHGRSEMSTLPTPIFFPRI